MKKTNVIRMLDSRKLDYKFYEYKADPDHVDGLSVARSIGLDPKKVYKTLVCQGHSKEHYVFVLPVEEELDLKAGAASVGEKSVHMIKQADLNKLTGYIRGGCSPLGMKKDFVTVVDQSAEELDSIVVSAGRIGLQVEIKPSYLEEFIEVKFEAITA